MIMMYRFSFDDFYTRNLPKNSQNSKLSQKVYTATLNSETGHLIAHTYEHWGVSLLEWVIQTGVVHG